MGFLKGVVATACTLGEAGATLLTLPFAFAVDVYNETCELGKEYFGSSDKSLLDEPKPKKSKKLKHVDQPDTTKKKAFSPVCDDFEEETEDLENSEDFDDDDDDDDEDFDDDGDFLDDDFEYDDYEIDDDESANKESKSNNETLTHFLFGFFVVVVSGFALSILGFVVCKAYHII